MSLVELLEGTGFSQPCEDLFSDLAQKNPSLLAAIIASGQLKIGDLTFAAEALGHGDNLSAPAILLGLLHHDFPVVREGAIYGAAEHLAIYGISSACYDELRARLNQMACGDPSPGVMAAATDACSDLFSADEEV